jgi:hypothetical protein
MRRPLIFLPCLLVLLSLIAIPSSGAGQRGVRTTVAGTWHYAGSANEGNTIVQQAVEPVLAYMDPGIQDAARERIAESTWLPTTIRIGARRGRIQVALTGRQRRTFSSALGQPVQVLRPHGDYAQLTQTVRDDGGLQQEFVAIDGTQQNIYVPGPRRTMVLDVTLISPALPSEIHFQLNYRR